MLVSAGEGILESMREDLAKVVVTDAYHRKTVDAINKHSFVLLAGEPAASKDDHRITARNGSALDQWKRLDT